MADRQALANALMSDDQAAMQPETYANPMVRQMLGSALTLPQRAIDASTQDVQHLGEPDYQRQSIGPALETATNMMGGAGVVPAEANTLRSGIKVYHGSPHDFNSFDMSKLGTGEGAQAYGHGLYFAENEGTARTYRDSLAPQVAGETLGWRTHEFSPQAKQAINANGGDIDAAIEAAQRGASRGERGAKFYGPVADELQQIKGIGRQKPGGNMYEVNINAEPEHFLDWDKPNSQQHPVVRAALDKLGLSKEEDLARAANNPEIIKQLNQAGVPGFKYLDQGSRASGDGSRNYVVFNDKILEIARKYGIAPAAVTPMMVKALMKSQMSEDKT